MGGGFGPITAVVVMAALVLLGGSGAIVWALNGDDGNPGHPVAVATPSVTAPAQPPGATDLPSTFPTPWESPTMDESMFVKAGDCVRIIGKAPKLKMFRTGCDSAPYKVLKRFSGTSDRTKCRSVRGYTAAFWFKSTKYRFLRFVLCLKHQ